VRSGAWKLVARRGDPWELYNLNTDRTELNNLAAAEPERVAALTREYEAWAKRCGVQPWPAAQGKK
jgi:arylsulfatase